MAGNGATDRKVGELVVDISEKTSRLVRDEIELAKAEIAEKVRSLGRGAAVVAIAGVFVLLAMIMFMHAFAWFLNDIFGFTQAVWLGFLIEALLFCGLAVAGGLYAKRALTRGAPPTPDMAIEEAERTIDTVRGVSSSQLAERAYGEARQAAAREPFEGPGERGSA